jgi:opacity protein-like surface antigen
MQFRQRERCALWRTTLLLLVCSVAPLFAQQSSSIPSQESKGIFDRISYGLRGSILFLPIQNDLSNTTLTSQTDPPLNIHSYSNNQSKRYGGGPTVQFDFTPKLSLNVDFLYHRLGHDAGTVINTQETDDNDAEFVSGDYQRTRADLWDVPIMLRYYRGSVEDEAGRRAFVSGGMTFRTISGIRSFNEHINDEGLSDSTTIPATTLRSTVPGLTAGVGWQFRDEVGIKVDLELRYTRWLQRVFDGPMSQSNLNQAEAVIGFTF